MKIDFIDKMTDVLLEVEVNPSGASRFEDEYREITGDPPTPGSGYQQQKNKWGREVRVYFNSEENLKDEFTSIDVCVDHGQRPYRDQWRYRTNNSDFFWELVRRGYRLGRN